MCEYLRGVVVVLRRGGTPVSWLVNSPEENTGLGGNCRDQRGGNSGPPFSRVSARRRA